MGVPKFFRYVSERYPCLSELVKEYQIPEFDNLYLDMNGIIHMCSHPDDNNPHFRITEERIFQDIFHYIDVIFRMIRPQKLFFMAVDGVAPRAKMNQQRGRRFRSAKDAEKMEHDAKKKGEVLPEQARFDSNCITPGTEFMARLHEQLKYYVVDRISNNPMWQKCKVILSGHETPGEGEHKIMDYIRYMRAQPKYDANTRHCLYGLDADLIMLGLCTHEPHFSLLREEVKFGRKSTKRQSVPEEITFYLLHLSLMREYLELEFDPLKEKLGFKYDFEKIIDDWVLMGFLVGNDFIPHLPNLHIANGALPVLYKAYMDILPTLDGYINECGTLNLARFEKFMKQLGSIDLDNFEEIRSDLDFMEAKTGRKWNPHIKVSTGLNNLEEWKPDDDSKFKEESLEPEKPKDPELAALVQECEDMCIDSTDEAEPDMSEEDEAFENYKRDYYRNKLEYSTVTPGVMRDQAEGYVRAIQWNLNYYYNGVCSWSWYYPHHYAPFISDIKNFQDLNFDFDLGKPFKPFEQLLAVLPTASKELLPESYHFLMTDEDSLISKYYPEEFQTDLNGKRQEWEAVVLVPFIDENLLLEAMKPCNEKLTPEEHKRNTHGPMHVYTYIKEDLGPYEPHSYFETIPSNHAKLVNVSIDEIRVPKEKLVKGAYPNVKMDVYYPGFPTMKHLKYQATLKKARIKVFETPSRNENMIISIIPNSKFAGNKIPVDLLGTTIFVGWPHLVEAKVVAISNSERKYINVGGPGQYNVEERTGNLASLFDQEKSGITEYYMNRMGIEVGKTNVLVYVQPMIGRKYVFSNYGRLTLEKEFSQNTAIYPLQTIVFNIAAYDVTHTPYKDVTSLFPPGCMCFTLANPYYGSQGIVLDSTESLQYGRVKICVSAVDEPVYPPIEEIEENIRRQYKSLFNAASQLSLNNYVFSRITGSIFITAKNNEGGFKTVNIGLDLRFNKKNKETPCYTKKSGNTWFYTDKSIELVRSYMDNFPEVFEFLSGGKKIDDVQAEQIFYRNCDERVKELLAWLKQVPTHSIEKQTCGTSLLELDVIKLIEDTVDTYIKNIPVTKVTMQIKPNLIYRPEVQSGTLVPDSKMEAKLLDRIVNVREGFSVPFGLKGTIIAIHQSESGAERDIMYDIVFDTTFKDGMAINCSPGRGYRLSKTSFINISYGQRLKEEKMGKPNELLAKAQAQSDQFSNYGQCIKQQNSAFAPFNGKQTTQIFGSAAYNNYPNQGFNQKFQPDHSSYNPYKSPATENNGFTRNISTNGSNYSEFNNSNSYQPWKPSVMKDEYRNGPNTPNYYMSMSRNKIAHSNDSLYSQNPPADNQGVNGAVNYDKEVGNFSRKMNSVSDDQTVRRNFHPKGKSTTDITEKTRAKIDTDFLRRVLQLDDTPSSVDKENANTSNQNVSNLQETDKSDRTQPVSLDVFATAENSNAIVGLLTYYQANGHGLPRYQYFTSRNGTIQGQVYLPNGESVIGKPGKTREEASENVATAVLEILKKRAVGEKPELPQEMLSSPPKIWVASTKQTEVGPSKHQSVTNNSQQNLNNLNGSTMDKGSMNPGAKSFVPLQAMKNINKSCSSMNTSSKASSNELLTTQSPYKTTNKTLKPDHDTTNSKRVRKPRIAANFGKK